MNVNQYYSQVARVWKSAGIFTGWYYHLGVRKRAFVGVLKLVNLTESLIPTSRKISSLERYRLRLFGELSVNYAQEKDLPEIVRIFQMRNLEFSPPLTQRQGITDLASFVGEKYRSGKWLLARRGEYIVGVLHLSRETSRYRLGYIAGHPQLGKGCGKEMLLFALKQAQQDGMEAIFGPTPSNSPAIRFINEIGGEIIEIIENARGPGINEIWWEKKL